MVPTKILFMDDLPMNRVGYINFFQDHQTEYEIVAVDSHLADGLLRGGEKFDLIVAEIVSSNFERDDVMPFFRQYAPGTPVILVTSTNFLLVRAIGKPEVKDILAQAEGYLYKEFTWDELKYVIEKILAVQPV